MENPLLRVSDFCRGRSPPKETPVSLSVLSTAKSTANSRIRNHDLSSVCLVSLEVLVCLSLYENSVAFLCHGSKKVLVRLIVIDDEDDGETSKETAMVPPVVIVNLGICYQEQIWSDADIINKKCFLMEAEQSLPIAQSIVLRPLGRRCPKAKWPNFFQNPKEDEEDDSWGLPLPNTLLQQSNLISVCKTNPEEDNVYYYEILDIILTNKGTRGENDGKVKPSQTASLACISSSSTQYELDGSFLPSSVRRLPPLLPEKKIHLEAHHPNLAQVMKALLQPPTLDVNEKILHVIGTDGDHCLRLCVETAARQVGMQCFSIRGLAAFGHHSGSTVRTGSLAEQLVGLQAAFQFIRNHRMEPCVLHLYDIDLEFCSADEPLRHEQEERFWAEFIKALTKTSPDFSSNKSTHSIENQFYYTPSLLIVLSTTCPLKPGPFMEKLVFPSIVLETPDLELTKVLWENNVPWNDSFWDHLKGRTAQDILWLSQQTLAGTTPIDLQKKCQKLDAKHRNQSSSKVARVSNVHWNDVGGLSHVRREILDAIELPLKHPHLFPSGGRAGILLYGPPGTGKTLVAKAVATECRLPFFSVKGPELLGSYVGESEASVRAIFQEARQAAAQNAPRIAASILFFDELDSLAPRRGGVGDGGGVMERVVATLFAELDGGSNSKEDSGRVFVIGATNRPDLLDPSLLRPGRLDRLVYLGVPVDDEERARVLAAQIRKLKLAGDCTDMARKVVSNLPDRLTGADLSTIATGAVSIAVQRLCRQADEEQRIMVEKSGILVDIDQILEGWDVDRRTPTVELDDLLKASMEVLPSLSQNDLDHYERLRDQYDAAIVARSLG